MLEGITGFRRAGLILLVVPFLAGVFAASAAAGPLTPKEQLGKAIFFDARLSTPNGMSCGTCHDPAAGFADPRPGYPVSQGVVPDRFGSRNANSVAYASFNGMFMFMPGMGPMNMGVYQGGQFWDGRSSMLIDQAKLPFLNPLEMNNPDSLAVVADVRSAKYAPLFQAVYGATSLDRLNKNHPEDVALAYDRVADAIAAYEPSSEVDSFSSKYDLYLLGEARLSDQESSGLALFQASCDRCHPSRPSATGMPPIFSSHHHANTGVPKTPDNPFYDVAATFNPEGHDYVDLGTGGAVGDPFHYGRFKIPSLRNVAVTAPYMHNGAFADLHTVADFYNTRDVAGAGWPAPEWSANVLVGPEHLGNIGLTDQQVDEIVAFLLTLTDGYVGQ
ncbi:MAG: cytochrome c peroxidase [Thermoleophilia bacterium]